MKRKKKKRLKNASWGHLTQAILRSSCFYVGTQNIYSKAEKWWRIISDWHLFRSAVICPTILTSPHNCCISDVLPNNILLFTWTILGMTRNYIIFIEQPLKMNLWKIISSKIRGKSFTDGISWEPQYNTRFHVVDKHTGQVENFDCEWLDMKANFHITDFCLVGYFLHKPLLIKGYCLLPKKKKKKGYCLLP